MDELIRKTHILKVRNVGSNINAMEYIKHLRNQISQIL